MKVCHERLWEESNIGTSGFFNWKEQIGIQVQYKLDRSAERYKTRLIAMGNTQTD